MKKIFAQFSNTSLEARKACESIVFPFFNIVKAHADVLTVRSSSDKGATFIIQLPKT